MRRQRSPMRRSITSATGAYRLWDKSPPQHQALYNSRPRHLRWREYLELRGDTKEDWSLTKGDLEELVPDDEVYKYWLRRIDPLMLVGPNAPLVAYVDESHSVAALACQREPTTGTASVGDYELREFFDACVLLCYVSNDPAMGHDDEAVTHAKSMMNVMGHDNRGESLVAQSEYI